MGIFGGKRGTGTTGGRTGGVDEAQLPDYADYSDEPDEDMLLASRLAELDEQAPVDLPDLDELSSTAFGGGSRIDVYSKLAKLEAGERSRSAPRQAPSRFSAAALDEVAGRKTAEREAAEREATLDVGAMSKEERKAYIDALGESLELYPHLLAIKPNERYVFRSDYIEVDGSGSVACVLAFFHRDETVDEFGPFWGVSRIPNDLPVGVRAMMLESVKRREGKWVDDALARSEKLDKMAQRDQNEGSMGAKRKIAKASEDIFTINAEIADQAVYLQVDVRMVLHADSLSALDTAIERLSRQYIELLPGVTVEPYHGEQRQELSSLLDASGKRRGKGWGFTSVEYAGAYSLVTNGLSDPAGEYVGRMSGDYNNAAILFEVDAWGHHVCLADDTLNRRLGRVRMVDMWGSKISQAALRNNRKVVHLVLNDADLDLLGPPLRSLTARVDMNAGELNPLEIFGSRKDQLALYGVQQNKLLLMTEQYLKSGALKLEVDSLQILQSALKSQIHNFYVEQAMWADNAADNQEKLRLVGLAHDDVPRLSVFASYFDTEHVKLLHQRVRDDTQLKAIKVLRDVYADMRDTAGDLFDNFTSEAVDQARSARRVIYDFSGLSQRGAGVAMAQLVNAVGFAFSGLEEGDTVIIHGADRIVDPAVQDYLTIHFDRLYGLGARVALLYDKPEKMLECQEFNQFNIADYTVLGPMAKPTIEKYEELMRSPIPDDLRALLSSKDSMLSYLHRGPINVVFGTELSLGLGHRAPAQNVGEMVAARVEQANRDSRLAATSRLAEAEQAEQARGQELRAAVEEKPAGLGSELLRPGQSSKESLGRATGPGRR